MRGALSPAQPQCSWTASVITFFDRAAKPYVTGGVARCGRTRTLGKDLCTVLRPRRRWRADGGGHVAGRLAGSQDSATTRAVHLVWLKLVPDDLVIVMMVLSPTPWRASGRSAGHTGMGRGLFGGGGTNTGAATAQQRDVAAGAALGNVGGVVDGCNGRRQAGFGVAAW